MPKHVHAECIKAWADGAKVQCRICTESEWQDIKAPNWLDHLQYRIKPEPKPDIAVYRKMGFDGGFLTASRDNPDIKFTFDGETGQLKAVELL